MNSKMGDIDELEPCFYCGVPANSIDHVPPRAMRKRMADLGEYFGVWVEVPACMWCNSTLGNLALLTLTDRKLYIKQRLRVKFKKLLASHDWTDEQLDELGYTLKTKILASMAKRRLVRQRIAW